MRKNYALIGERTEHSISPELHKIILEILNIKEEYKKYNIDRENLLGSIEDLKKQNIKGLNVTIPYKETIMEHLDEISKEAKKIKAVNTVYFKENRLIGYNSDYYGFGALMRRNNFDVKEKSIVILGTGGSSKAVYQYTKDNKAKEIIFVSRKKSSKNNIIDYKELENLKKKDIIINTTPIGMYPKINKSPISKEVILNFKIAVDIIYNPLETEFLKYAKESGIKHAGGLFMLVYQGIKSQEIWNNVKVQDREIEYIYQEIKKIFNS